MQEKLKPLNREITPEQIHNWYLEATQKIDPVNYNAKAQKPFKDLTEQ